MVSGEVEFVVNGNFQNKEEPVVNDNDVVEKSKSEVSYKPDWEINLQDRGLEQGGGGQFSRIPEVGNNRSWLGICLWYAVVSKESLAWSKPEAAHTVAYWGNWNVAQILLFSMSFIWIIK